MEKKKHRYTEQEAYFKLSSLCAIAEYCCHDIMKKMNNWEWKVNIDEDDKKQHNEAVERVKANIITRLLKERFIDESRFAHAFVRDKFRYNHWGRIRIAQELRLRKIDNNIIDSALEEIDNEENIDKLSDILRKKLPTIKGKNDYEIRCKLIRFAMGRGFTYDDIEDALSQIL